MHYKKETEQNILFPPYFSVDSFFVLIVRLEQAREEIVLYCIVLCHIVYVHIPIKYPESSPKNAKKFSGISQIPAERSRQTGFNILVRIFSYVSNFC